MKGMEWLPFMEYKSRELSPSCKKLSCYMPWRHMGGEEVLLLLILNLH
jgi:hypothetical protein